MNLNQEEQNKMTLMNETLLAKTFDDDNSLMEYVLRIMLQRNDLTVMKCKATKEIDHSPFKNNIRLDVLAKDEKDTFYDIKILVVNKDFSPSLLYLYPRMIIADYFKQGIDLDTLPQHVPIAILGYDYYADGEPYHEITAYDEADKTYHPEIMDEFVLNQKYVSDSDFGKLMHDFDCADTSKMLLPKLKEKVEHCKSIQLIITSIKRVLGPPA